MANPTISQITIGSTTYDICDANARDSIVSSKIDLVRFTNEKNTALSTSDWITGATVTIPFEEGHDIAYCLALGNWKFATGTSAQINSNENQRSVRIGYKYANDESWTGMGASNVYHRSYGFTENIKTSTFMVLAKNPSDHSGDTVDISVQGQTNSTYTSNEYTSIDIFAFFKTNS